MTSSNHPPVPPNRPQGRSRASEEKIITIVGLVLAVLGAVPVIVDLKSTSAKLVACLVAVVLAALFLRALRLWAHKQLDPALAILLVIFVLCTVIPLVAMSAKNNKAPELPGTSGIPPTMTTPTAPSSAATTAVVNLSIEKPANNGTVAMLDDIHTRIKGASGGQVWIIIRKAGGSSVFPQGPCDLEAELSICRKAQFGDESDDTGTTFNATVVIINPADAHEYEKYRANGFLQGAPPVKPLANSQTITVHRA